MTVSLTIVTMMLRTTQNIETILLPWRSCLGRACSDIGSLHDSSPQCALTLGHYPRGVTLERAKLLMRYHPEQNTGRWDTGVV